MSLRVNLILPEEQRSTGGISGKSFSRIGTIAIPAIAVFAIAHGFFNSTLMSSELRVLESRWETAEPKQEHALKLAGRVRYNQDTIKEMDDWKASHIDWNEQILAVMEAAPDTIRATTLIVTQEANNNAVPSPPQREFTLTVEGKTSGENAIRHVEAFKEGIENHAAADIIEEVEVVDYNADTDEDAGELDRVFQVECRYKMHPVE